MRHFPVALLLAATFSANAFASAEPSFSSVYRQFQKAAAAEDYSKAAELAGQAYTLGKAKFGEHSENTANLLFSYANMLVEAGQIKEGFERYNDVEHEYTELFGYESENTLMFYLSAIDMRQNIGNKVSKEIWEDSDRWVRRAVSITDKLAELHPDMAAGYYHETVLMLSKLSLIPLTESESKHFAERAVQAAKAMWGESDKRTLETQFVLGMLYESGKDYKDAISTFEHIANTFDNAVSFSHPYALGSHARLVSLYEEEGEPDKATRHCRAIGAMTPWTDDIEPTPLYRKDPKYPTSYARMNKEGWVRLVFDITEDGFVKNIRVVDTSGGDRFADASKKALATWRYAPQFVDGHAVYTKDRMVQLDFKLAS